MTTKYFIYLGDNPTGFVGLEGNVKRNFMIAIDEDANKQRVKDFLKSGDLVTIPKSDFDKYVEDGIDRKRNEVKKYLENKKIPFKERVKPGKPKIETEDEYSEEEA